MMVRDIHNGPIFPKLLFAELIDAPKNSAVKNCMEAPCLGNCGTTFPAVFFSI